MILVGFPWLVLKKVTATVQRFVTNCYRWVALSWCLCTFMQSYRSFESIIVNGFSIDFHKSASAPQWSEFSWFLRPGACVILLRIKFFSYQKLRTVLQRNARNELSRPNNENHSFSSFGACVILCTFSFLLLPWTRDKSSEKFCKGLRRTHDRKPLQFLAPVPA